MTTIVQDKLVLSDMYGANHVTYEMTDGKSVFTTWEDQNGSIGEETMSTEQAREEVEELLLQGWS